MESVWMPINGWIKIYGIYTQWNLSWHLEDWNYFVFWLMDGIRDFHVKWNEPVLERQVSHIIYLICGN
jgi:hypothetical protein